MKDAEGGFMPVLARPPELSCGVASVLTLDGRAAARVERRVSGRMGRMRRGGNIRSVSEARERERERNGSARGSWDIMKCREKGMKMGRAIVSIPHTNINCCRTVSIANHHAPRL